MRTLLAGLFGRKATLSALEASVLDAARARLDPDMSMLWERQISSINKVQRLPGGVEVNFYCLWRGKVNRDPAMAFPNRTEELRVAKVTLELATQCLVATIWAVEGYVFSIEYAGGSKYFEEALGMDPPPKLDARCELLADLAQAM